MQKREAFEVWGFRAQYCYKHPGMPIMQEGKVLMAMIVNEILTGVPAVHPFFREEGAAT